MVLDFARRNLELLKVLKIQWPPPLLGFGTVNYWLKKSIVVPITRRASEKVFLLSKSLPMRRVLESSYQICGVSAPSMG